MGRVPLRHPPRHLAAPRRSRTDAREHVVGEWLLAAIAIVLTTAVVIGSLFNRSDSGQDVPATDPPAAAPTTAAAPTSTVAPGRPASGGNLAADPGFEVGLAGWRPIGGARIERTTPARGGRWAAGLTATGAADQGMALVEVLRCLAGRSYAATIWVQASRPDALLQVNLLEVVAGKRYAVDTVGAVLSDRRWQRVEVVHLAHRPGATLALELVLPRGSPRSTILVDDLEVMVHKASFMRSAAGLVMVAEVWRLAKVHALEAGLALGAPASRTTYSGAVGGAGRL
jgi:hypothetical protein